MKIAIIGSGISGLASAYLLQRQYEVVMFEKNATLGGHARTLEVETQGKSIAVDTGFIVFNNRNYPHLTGLFRTLGVPFHKSNMSFAASIDGGTFEYSSKSLQGLFPTIPAMFEKKRWKMVSDYFRFSSYAKAYLKSEGNLTLGELIDASGVSDAFKRQFILPIGAAIWSCPLSQMLDYPARTFVRFFENHGLLDVNGQPQWLTVTGGSREYVKRVVAALGEGVVRCNSAIAKIERTDDGVWVKQTNGQRERFDQVVMASHADESLAMIANPTADEKKILGAFRFQKNEAYLHSDPRYMPNNHKCWASWVYQSQGAVDEAPALTITYWMNLLQGLDKTIPLFVTLNPKTAPDAALVYNHHTFTHPIFDQAAIDAQGKLDDIQGEDRIWFCGAWMRYGFHEDGILSAVKVAKSLGVSTPWS